MDKDKDKLEEVVKYGDQIGKNAAHYMLYAVRNEVKDIEDKSLKLSTELVLWQYSIIVCMKIYLVALGKLEPRLNAKMRSNFLRDVKRFLGEKE